MHQNGAIRTRAWPELGRRHAGLRVVIQALHPEFGDKPARCFPGAAFVGRNPHWTFKLPRSGLRDSADEQLCESDVLRQPDVEWALLERFAGPKQTPFAGPGSLHLKHRVCYDYGLVPSCAASRMRTPPQRFSDAARRAIHRSQVPLARSHEVTAVGLDQSCPLEK